MLDEETRYREVIISITAAEQALFSAVSYSKESLPVCATDEERRVYEGIISAVEKAHLQLLGAKNDVRELFSIYGLPIERFRDH